MKYLIALTLPGVSQLQKFEPDEYQRKLGNFSSLVSESTVQKFVSRSYVCGNSALLSCDSFVKVRGIIDTINKAQETNGLYISGAVEKGDFDVVNNTVQTQIQIDYGPAYLRLRTTLRRFKGLGFYVDPHLARSEAPTGLIRNLFSPLQDHHTLIEFTDVEINTDSAVTFEALLTVFQNQSHSFAKDFTRYLLPRLINLLNAEMKTSERATAAVTALAEVVTKGFAHGKPYGLGIVILRAVDIAMSNNAKVPVKDSLGELLTITKRRKSLVNEIVGYIFDSRVITTENLAASGFHVLAGES